MTAPASEIPIVRKLLAFDCGMPDFIGGPEICSTVTYRNPDGPEAAALIEELVEALRGLVTYAEAVRHTAGMGKNQLARLEAAKALLAKARGQ